MEKRRECSLVRKSLCLTVLFEVVTTFFFSTFFLFFPFLFEDLFLATETREKNDTIYGRREVVPIVPVSYWNTVLEVGHSKQTVLAHSEVTINRPFR